MKKRSLLTALCLFTVLAFSFAQTSKEKLEAERRNIQGELKNIQDVYNRVKKEGKQSLVQLDVLKRKISLQERFISTINKELHAIDDDMYHSNLEIYRLQKQLDTLKVEYARNVLHTYRNRNSFTYVNFIFSATSFNDAVHRIVYLRNYRANREHQVKTIQETQNLINRRQQQQIVKKQQKNETLEEETKERAALAEQRKEKDHMVSGFKSKEKDLQKQIAARKKRDREIQHAIATIIRREIETARKEEAARAAAAKKMAGEKKAEKTAVAKSSGAGKKSTSISAPPLAKSNQASVLEVKEKDIELGTDFGKSRGKLPWPVDNEVIQVPFGKYRIEGTPIEGDNPGLTIGTRSGGPVKAIFDGVVSAVHNYGDGAAIIIRHGKYYTSYANLSGVNVQAGATVKRGQLIGKAGDSEDGSGGSIDFMLLIESKNVNPQPWLRR